MPRAQRSKRPRMPNTSPQDRLALDSRLGIVLRVLLDLALKISFVVLSVDAYTHSEPLRWTDNGRSSVHRRCTTFRQGSDHRVSKCKVNHADIRQGPEGVAVAGRSCSTGSRPHRRAGRARSSPVGLGREEIGRSAVIYRWCTTSRLRKGDVECLSWSRRCRRDPRLGEWDLPRGFRSSCRRALTCRLLIAGDYSRGPRVRQKNLVGLLPTLLRGFEGGCGRDSGR